MHISQLNLHSGCDVVRVEAQVAWEEVENPPLTLFVETDLQFQRALYADPNAFLLGCLLPAWRAGERRVKIDGALCPVVCQNIKVALATLQSWYPKLGPPPTIEPSHGFETYRPFGTQAVSLLSCGIDSLATLRLNNLHIPSDHPGSIVAVIVMLFDRSPSLAGKKLSKDTIPRLLPASNVAADAGVALIPARTNLWWLVGDGYFYDYKWQGAVLSSIASFFSRGFHKAYIASSYGSPYLHPWGSHPLLEPYYSSAYFQIEHHGMEMTRLEKTALVAEWPVALHNIRVCQNDSKGEVNCGSCEKCIRTMTALSALGKLKSCRSFPLDEVNADLLGTIEEYRMIKSDYDLIWYKELIPLLMERQRQDLVAVIEKVNTHPLS